MDVKKIILCLLGATYMLVSCSSAPTNGEEDFAAQDASAPTDSNAELSTDAAASNQVAPVDEFSENNPAPPPESAPQDQAQVQDSLEPQPVDQPPVEPQQPIVESTPKPQTVVLESPAASKNMPVHITNVEFKGNESGGTLVISTSGDFKFNQTKNTANRQLIIEIPNSTLDKKASRPLLLKDFKGGIGAVSTYYSASNQTTRVILELRQGAPEVLVQPEMNSLLVVTNEGAVQTDQVLNTEKLPEPNKNADVTNNSGNVRAGSQNIADAFNSKNFEGEEIDCNFNETNTKDLLLFIGEQIGANIIVDEIPESTVDINIQTVPWDHCVAIILKLKRLGYSKIGNILRVTTLENIRKENEEALKNLKDSEELAPLKVRLFPISFADGKDLEKLISTFLTKNRGSASFDTRTNSFIVTDSEDVLRQIGIMIKNLDTPPKQVLIEGKIVEASANFSKQMGINWGFSGAPVKLGSKTSFTPNFSIGSPNKGADSGDNSLGFNIGVIDFIGSLTASLALLEKEDKVKVLSSPRIVTINNLEAKIGTNAIIKPVSKDNTGKFTEGTPVEVKLNLTVNPQVTNDGSVKMKIDVNRDFTGVASDPSISSSAPKYSRTISTNVLVKNGQTSVIGGVFQNDTSEGEIGISGLKDIPIFGFLFRQKQTVRANTELLVFLTPKILSYNENGEANSN